MPLLTSKDLQPSFPTYWSLENNGSLTPFECIITSSAATANNINIATGTTLALDANALLDRKGNITGDGTFIADASEANVTLSGLSSQIVPGGS